MLELPATTPRDTRPGFVAWVTGERSPNRETAVGGTDLGIVWDAGDGRCLVAFGDTFNPRDTVGGGGAGGDWRCNVVAWTRNRDLHRGVRLDGWVTDRPGHARQVIARDRMPGIEEFTVIPTAGVSVNGRQFLTYMSVQRWGEPGYWTTNHAGVVYSDDGGRTWVKDPLRWPASSRPLEQMHAIARRGGYVYLFSTPAGRQGSAVLSRVPEGRLLDPLAHEHLMVDGRWSTRTDHPSYRRVFGPDVSELSVVFHRATGKWLATYAVPGGMVYRTAPAPEGPWTAPTRWLDSRLYPGSYGAFLHPFSLDSRAPYAFVSHWVPYNVSLIRMPEL